MFSVVIPLYNKERSVGRAIESVINQTCGDWELIVVNDGSTDRSPDIVRGFADDRIKLINKPNGGVSSARNEGVRNATGQHVAFLDADDCWASDYLEELSKLILSFPDAGIYGFSNYIDNGKGLQFDSHGMPENYRGVINNIWKLGVPYWTSAVTITRPVFNAVGLFDERMDYGEDMDMWWRILMKYKGAYYNKPLVYYCVDAENRAMDKPIPFEKHIPYYIEKYEQTRLEDADFRFFCDRECLYRLFQYATERKYRKDLKRVLKQVDFSLQKTSMKLRFIFPRLYRLYMTLVGR